MSSSDNEADDYAARGFALRLETALGGREKGVIARRAQVAPSTLTKYLAGASEPGAFKAARLAESLGVSLDWLLTGRGLPNAAASGYVAIPIYDVRLAAGSATFADGARQIGEMPFDYQLLRELGRTDADGLGVVEADGDSMHPTIPDYARVLLDLKDTRLREGIFAFRLGDELRVKRLRRLVDAVEIISDNDRYPVERLAGDRLEHFQIIGRAKWAGTIL